MKSSLNDVNAFIKGSLFIFSNSIHCLPTNTEYDLGKGFINSKYLMKTFNNITKISLSVHFYPLISNSNNTTQLFLSIQTGITLHLTNCAIVPQFHRKSLANISDFRFISNVLVHTCTYSIIRCGYGRRFTLINLYSKWRALNESLKCGTISREILMQFMPSAHDAI